MGETKSNTGKKDAAKKILFWFGVLFTIVAPIVIGALLFAHLDQNSLILWGHTIFDHEHGRISLQNFEPSPVNSDCRAA